MNALRNRWISVALGGALGCLAIVVGAAPGDLDSAFGSGGTLMTSFGPGPQDQAHAVAIQGDGRIVLAGDSIDGGRFVVALARYTPLGALDTSFGSGGRVLTPLPASDGARGVAIQSDGRIVVVTAAFTVLRYLPDGTLDSTFGSAGIATTPFTGSASGAGVAIQADGRIVVGGTVGGTQNGQAKNEFALARYETDGALDATFGTGGLVTTSFGVFTNPGDVATAVAIRGDGHIVLAGYTTLGDGLHMAIAQYLPNGTLDPLFFGSGPLDATGKTIAVATGWANALALQPDGRILVGGSNKNEQFVVARFTTTGAADIGFGPAHTGTVATAINPAGNSDEVFALGVQGNGAILAAGLTHGGSPSGFDFALARYEPGGIIDASFGANGIVMTPIATVAGPFIGNDYAQALAIGPDGRAVVAGMSSVDKGNGSDFSYVFSAARYLTDAAAPVDPRADLSLTMSADPTDPQVGSDTTFAIVVTNSGPADATGVRVRAILPSSLALQSAPGAVFDPVWWIQLDPAECGGRCVTSVDARGASNSRCSGSGDGRHHRVRSARSRLDARDLHPWGRRPGDDPHFAAGHRAGGSLADAGFGSFGPCRGRGYPPARDDCQRWSRHRLGCQCARDSSAATRTCRESRHVRPGDTVLDRGRGAGG